MNLRARRWLALAGVWLGASAVALLGLLAWQAYDAQSRSPRLLLVAGPGTPAAAIELPRAADGHHHWPGQVQGRELRFLVDSGASHSALPASLARELGLPVVGRLRSATATGHVEADLVEVDVQLQGGLALPALRLVAMPGLATPLVGMDVLGGLNWQHRDGVLRIDLGERSR